MKDASSEAPPDSEQLQKAKEWEKKMVEKGFYRSYFFQAFSDQLTRLFDKPISILEVGSGPGHLAEFIIQTVKVEHYTLFDLSEAMNHIALKRLAQYDSIIDHGAGDFLNKQHFATLGLFDAVICMQSVHEVGDKRLATDIYDNVNQVLKPGGYFLVCDFILGDPGMKNNDVYMTVEEQGQGLTKSGFKSVQLVSNHAGLTLYVAQK